MMRLPPFRYLAPASAQEAARILADNGPDAMAVAGGTDLFPNMKRRQFTPRVLVGLRGLAGAARVRVNGELTMGAMATLTDIARSCVFFGYSSRRRLRPCMIASTTAPSCDTSPR